MELWDSGKGKRGEKRQVEKKVRRERDEARKAIKQKINQQKERVSELVGGE